jgi:hypothetical protein
MGWKVWVGLPENPGVQHASLRGALPIPEYREPQEIEVSEDLLQ